MSQVEQGPRGKCDLWCQRLLLSKLKTEGWSLDLPSRDIEIKALQDKREWGEVSDRI